MKRFANLLSAIVITAICATTTYAAENTAVTTAAPEKIAIVDMRKIISQSPMVNSLSKKLRDQFKPRQAKIDADQKALRASMDNLQKNAPTMTKSEQTAQQKKLDSGQAALVKEAIAFQQDVGKEQTAIMDKILKQLNTIIADVAKQNNYGLVLDSQAVVYSVSATDITSQVQARFDKSKA